MVYMNQGDLFNLIVELKFARQVDIARAFCDSSDLNLIEKDIQTCINRAKKGKTGKPLDNTIGRISKDEFINRLFPALFKDCDSSAGAGTKMIKENYEKIKKYLNDKQLTFHRMEELAECTDCEAFVKCMMLEALDRHSAHSGKETTSVKAVEFDSSLVPILHSQTIYCPSKFFDRDILLNEIYDTLQNYKLVILCGIGGIGKTYLSRQYAHLYTDKYSYEQIVTYDKNSKSIKKAILSLQFDNLNESEMSDNDKFEKRMHLLNKMSDNTLLIIDNLDTKPDDLKYFDDLRMNSGIHIIVTTRLTDCFPSNQTINISSMPANDQMDFFKTHYTDDLTQEDDSVVKDILKCIDGHTLLIELVAKSMHASVLSPSEMLDYLRGDTVTELLPVSINKDNLSAEKRTMADFIKLLFDVGYLDDTAKEALLYLSLLPVEGVNRKFFYNLMPKFRESFNDLISNSWAIEDNHGQILRLHPVIRDMLRKEMHPSINNCNAVMTNLHSHLQTSGSKLSEIDKADVCRILGSISEIDDFYANCNNVTMLTFFAEFCYKAYQFELALELYKTVVNIAVDSPVQTTTTIYLKIGDVYKRLASYEESIESYKFALESNKRQQSSTEKNLQDADIYERLSDIYRKASDYDQAMEYNDLAVSIYDDPANGAAQTQIAEIYNRRGIIFLNKSASNEASSSERSAFLEDALICYKKGLDIRKKCGDSKRQLAYSYHNVGTAYNKLGEFRLAKENHEKALQLRESSPDVPMTDIASSHVWIGNDYMALGDSFWELAKEHFEKSLEIRESILGKTHPEVAWSLISLSEWYENKGDYQKAFAYAERAYHIRSAKFSPDHNYVIQVSERVEKLRKEVMRRQLSGNVSDQGRQYF